ncbi:MAG TPA: alpha/beta hydrolase [Ktedonobacterales bacterium]
MMEVSVIVTVGEILAAIVGGIALLLGAGLLYRALRQWRKRRALRIQTPNKIEEGQFVQIGALAQWIQIRGESRDNPILLVLHGGPGIAFSAFTPIFRSWERDFTLVQWDQPGAGKTFSRNGRTASADVLTIERMAQDGIQVVERVLRHLNQRKLILFAASWGTVLGTIMVKRRPDLFSAYVGAGQFVNAARSEPLGYELALERAGRLGGRQGAQGAAEDRTTSICRSENVRTGATGARKGRRGDVSRVERSLVRGPVLAGIYAPRWRFFFSRSPVLGRQARTANDGL